MSLTNARGQFLRRHQNTRTPFNNNLCGFKMATVTIEQGKLRGTSVVDNGASYYEFLCVPYAKPPIGDLRFKSPQPPESWDGERDATTVNEINISMQNDIFKGWMGSEDCLYLNVFTPKLPEGQSKLLPVMVYFHSGGFICGNGIDKDELGPQYLIKHDVVVVTINYRLSIFGFLSLDIPEAAGNMGLKDQVQALKWVQSNIKHFGGDNSNVTIFGTSAGSASVEYHIISPMSKGLYQKAIMQSGSILNHWAINREPKSYVNRLLKEMEFKGSKDNVKEVYEYLVTSNAKELLEGTDKVMHNLSVDYVCTIFVPTIEKDFGNGDCFITDNPYKLLKEGKFNKVPVIKGYCSDEGYLTSVTKPHCALDLVENKTFLKHFAFDIDTEHKEKLNEEFKAAYAESISLEDDKDKMAVDFFGDLDFKAGIVISGKIMANLGVPVYMYEFGYDGNMNYLKLLFGITRKGVAHADDLTYVFKHTNFAKFARDNDLTVVSNITNMWANFAKTGAPTLKDSELQWEMFSSASQTYLYIDEKLIIKSNIVPKKIAIFEEIFDKYVK